MSKEYQPGETVAGKYQLAALLGKGGMGAVWRAHNMTLDVDVALKLIRRDDAENTEGPLLGDRLLQEARAAARLGHPSIARVFDFGVSELGDAYIVMELLEGEDLAQALVRRGRLSTTKAVATLLPIAHALEAAHQKGIVHRDLKPENVFLARAEQGRVIPKLVDFGIAKIQRTKNKRLTQTGTMLGSPLYMSPEQARGDDVDHLADVWALCVVLYELVCGRTPFEGKNYNALLYAIIADEPVPLPELGVGDEALWAILERGFQKDPTLRWQSMRELGSALARWSIDHGQHEDITGASLNAQWLRAPMPSGDMLASMVPPASEESESAGLQVLDRTTEIQPRREAEHATLEGRVVSLPMRARKRRLVAIALVSATLGAVAAVTVLVKHQQASVSTESEAARPVVVVPAAAVASQATESERPAVEPDPVAVANLGPAPTEQAEPTAAPASSASSAASTPLVADSAAPKLSATSAASPPVRRAPRWVRPAKKTKLKNPFD
jgi:serine/threonine-protein kinase